MFSLALAGAASITTAVLLLWRSVSAARGTAPSIASNLGTAPTDLRVAVLDRSARQRVVEPGLERVSDFLRRLTPNGLVESLDRRIVHAGMTGTVTVEQAIAYKAGLTVIGVVLGLLARSSMSGLAGMVCTFLPPAMGFFAVDVILDGRVQRRQEAIALALPDTIDQVTVSVGAGLGLESAMARAARSGSGPLAEELARTLQDTRAGMSRNTALRALIDRTNVSELRTVVLALLQAESYGVPIGHVLRVQSAELRMKRRQRAEERAMKLPVKVLFPLMLCILPTVFIVLLGPAAIRITRMFDSL